MPEQNHQYPLIELFTRLREAGLPLGIDEYQLALRALQSGFGISDRQALERLCRTLWVKSTEEKLLFDYHFEQVITERSSSNKKDNELKKSIYEQAPSERDVAFKFRKNWYFLLIASSGVLSTLLLTFLSLLRPQQNTCPSFVSRPVPAVEEGKTYQYNIEVCKSEKSTEFDIHAHGSLIYFSGSKNYENATCSVKLVYFFS